MIRFIQGLYILLDFILLDFILLGFISLGFLCILSFRVENDSCAIENGERAVRYFNLGSKYFRNFPYLILRDHVCLRFDVILWR